MGTSTCHLRDRDPGLLDTAPRLQKIKTTGGQKINTGSKMSQSASFSVGPDWPELAGPEDEALVFRTYSQKS